MTNTTGVHGEYLCTRDVLAVSARVAKHGVCMALFPPVGRLHRFVSYLAGILPCSIAHDERHTLLTLINLKSISIVGRPPRHGSADGRAYVLLGEGDHALLCKLASPKRECPTAAINRLSNLPPFPSPVLSRLTTTMIEPGDTAVDRATSGGSGIFAVCTFSKAAVYTGHAALGLAMAAAASMLLL